MDADPSLAFGETPLALGPTCDRLPAAPFAPGPHLHCQPGADRIALPSLKTPGTQALTTALLLSFVSRRRSTENSARCYNRGLNEVI